MLKALLHGIFGCAHARTTFPLTLKAGPRTHHAEPTGVYVTCLDCGQEFNYDWAAMRRGKAVQASRAVETGTRP